MSELFFPFIGLQLISLAIAGAILFQCFRVRALRTQIFTHLGLERPERDAGQNVMVILYILTTALLLIVSSIVFFSA